MDDQTSTFVGTNSDTVILKGHNMYLPPHQQTLTSSELGALPKQSASLFSKNGYLKRREFNGNKNSEIDGGTTYSKYPGVEGAPKAQNSLQSKGRQGSSKDGGAFAVGKKFRSGLKKMNKS